MRLLIIFFLFLNVSLTWAQPKPEVFVIQLFDRKISILSPAQKKPVFSVLVENKSLSDHVGKFIVQGKLLKFISVKSGNSESVEIENKTATNVMFVPVSPAFQEVELIFGKKNYEVPPKK